MIIIFKLSNKGKNLSEITTTKTRIIKEHCFIAGNKYNN